MNHIFFVFSYWIFIWYVLYMSNVINYNPKFAIIIGIIENISILLFMFYFNTKFKTIVLFVIIVCLTKLIPIYTIWNTKILIKDIISTFIILTIYCIFMIINDKTIYHYIEDKKNMIIHNKYGVGMKFLESTSIFKFLD